MRRIRSNGYGHRDEARRREPGRPSSDSLIQQDGGLYYSVTQVDRLPPFLMTVVSDGDRWMYVSSTGALTAGRRDAAQALFPYETDDRLHGAAGLVGPVTTIRVASDEGEVAWRPFRGKPSPRVQRSLYKSIVGDSVIFEERHERLGLRFRYRWASSERYGFIRTASLLNDREESLHGKLIDGLVNILPYGLEPSLYQRMSNLTNAYKRSEIIDSAGNLAVYSLESPVVDRPEPSEVMRSTVVWSVGLEDATATISPDSVCEFDAGSLDSGVSLLTGKPGAYLLSSTFDVESGRGLSWQIVADVGQDQVDVAALRALLRSDTDLSAALEESLREATESLTKIMAPADGLQCTGDRVATAHHLANVTYNVMRGGVPLSGYRVQRHHFTDYVRSRNRATANRHAGWLRSLPAQTERKQLLEQIEARGDVDLTRLGLEYLPFGFSRRHGDPSRPWNAFSIRVRDQSGEPIIHYEGNWRDIFQNWEALCRSFPEYLPGVITVFVNASTRDGFNPYRITSRGIDWEVPVADDPWSNIGYWGDHQIVYLLRLLEAADQFLPGNIDEMMSKRSFTYADVPYRLAPYPELVQDPKSTIRYDELAASLIAARVDGLGADGKLVWDRDGHLVLVTLLEKLLVPALAKLSNFVPGGGIWMNTQRPEWNDANNALVGYGLSMVTLNHLRRYLRHLRALVEGSGLEEVELSNEVGTWLSDISAALQKAPPMSELTDRRRKATMDELGRAFSEYRNRVYNDGFTGATSLTREEVIELCDTAMKHLDETIRRSRRDDGLYHSYNLIRFSDDKSEATVLHLHEMLEGQVAVLDSGVLSAEERAGVLDVLFDSDLYRADQRSFLLYPARELESFLQKNVIPHAAVESNGLLNSLIEAGDDSVVTRDVDNVFRFTASIANRADLVAELDRLGDLEAWSALVSSNRHSTLEIYEEVFRHHSYTGRSGSMYGYEGIGSIYWHMVAKLLVAVQESALWAAETGASPMAVQRLIDHYWRIRSGLGFNKSAEEFGAIPVDPYSHTPAHGGAQQPGMTGAVKEELLTRQLEVGVRIVDGEVQFDPMLLRHDELLDRPSTWHLYDLKLQPVEIRLTEGTLGVTLCQVPVIVSTTEGEPFVEVVLSDGTHHREKGANLPRRLSAMVFARTGEIARIHAHVAES